jgi:hypothetical protein
VRPTDEEIRHQRQEAVEMLNWEVALKTKALQMATNNQLFVLKTEFENFIIMSDK